MKLVASAGVDLDPWQEDWLDVAMGQDATGRWAATTCGLVAPRQNGKGEVIAARVLWGLLVGGERLALWSSHEVKTNLESFAKLRGLIEGCPALERRVRTIREANGSEGVYFKNGARVRFVARSRSSGRGFSPQLVILDEAYDLDDAAMAALFPSLSAQKAPQVWYVSSAPHLDSAVLRRVMLRGRSGVAEGLAYAEHCADSDAPSSDVAAWAQANPALGIRISSRFVAKELDTLSAVDFRRERLGIVDLDSPDDSAFSAAAWANVQYPGSRIGETGVVFGVDATRNLGWGAIVAADRRGRVEVVETREGVDWLEARVVEVANRHAGTVAIDVGGPVGFLADRLGDLTLVSTPTRG